MTEYLLAFPHSYDVCFKVLVIGATCMSSQDVWGAGIGDLASSSRKAIPFLTCFDRTIELVGPSQRDR